MEPLTELRDSRVLAVLRAPTATGFARASDLLVEAGIRCVEYSLTSTGALQALRDYVASGSAGVVLGAGTVLDVESASAAVDAGANYLVTPALCLDVLERSAALGVPVIAGAFTPTEILQAWRAGAAAVKVFPAAQAGGPAYVKALQGPLPGIPLVPTGGVAVSDAADYLAAGAMAVALGSPLVGDLAGGLDHGELQRRAADLLAAVAAVPR